MTNENLEKIVCFCRNDFIIVFRLLYGIEKDRLYRFLAVSVTGEGIRILSDTKNTLAGTVMYRLISSNFK